jgi:hypothetical protein
MNKYSPAPWHVESADPKFEGDDRCDVYPPQDLPQGSRIPVAMSIHPENARLIAAAPDLLAALQDVVDAYQKHFDAMPVAWQTYDNIARQAIEKATGN